MKKLFGHEKFRFLIAGGLNTGLDFVLLNSFVFLLGAIPIFANIVSVSIGITISYILNHKFVFRSKEKLSLKKYLLFFAVTGFSSLIIQTVIIIIFQSFFKTQFSHSIFIIKSIAEDKFMELNVAKLSAVLVGMVWNFTLYKYFIFKTKDKDGREIQTEIEDLL